MEFAVKNTNDKNRQTYIWLLNQLLDDDLSWKDDSYYWIDSYGDRYISQKNRDNIRVLNVTEAINILKWKLWLPSYDSTPITTTSVNITYTRDYRRLNPYLM